MICEIFKNEYPGYEHCILCNGNDESFYVEANNMEFIVNNASKKKFMVIEIDDCIIKNEQAKCDFLFIDCDDDTLYFVELKGKKRGVPYAIEQILMTLNKCSINKFYIDSKSVSAYIVASKLRRPKIVSAERDRLKNELYRKNGKLSIMLKKHEIKV
ncbi:hypothetical protein [Candidatus Magnetominusculus xianensis]|uniref:Uncharacterized protein n=1 Tax=Candidatus Magnetominusculus xianensis TaxID=1748249 RepID=A0ABR5SHA9_9BACT|nr:hypothetical protein [Candidatus Magnetominusculus xianensis]KWT91069.1 hypothetical protein ASN18_0893 [Candidatus Magnetominusculus xianensis]MBF0403286.1 hypothetical protein [Nitrospirota bacterium]